MGRTGRLTGSDQHPCTVHPRREDHIFYDKSILVKTIAAMCLCGLQVRAWLDSVGDAYISKKDLGDSLDSAYSLQEECLNIEAQLQVTTQRICVWCVSRLTGILCSRFYVLVLT